MNELESLGYVGKSYCYNIDTYCNWDIENNIAIINIDYDDKQVWYSDDKKNLTFDEIKAICKLIEEVEE